MGLGKDEFQKNGKEDPLLTEKKKTTERTREQTLTSRRGERGQKFPGIKGLQNPRDERSKWVRGRI